MPENVLVIRTTYSHEDKQFPVETKFIVDKEKLKKIHQRERQSLKEYFNISDEDEMVGATGCKKKVHKVDVLFDYKECNGTPLENFGIPSDRINVDVVPIDLGDRSIIKISLSDKSIDEMTMYIARSKMISAIISGVCEYYGVSKENVMSPSRIAKYAHPRQVITYLIYRYKESYNMSLNDIGAVFGQSHATILNSVKVIEDKISVYKNIKSDINKLREDFDRRLMLPIMK